MTTNSETQLSVTVEGALQRMLKSPLFVQADRQRRLLRYIVDASLDGRAARLNQFTLGIDVFDRDEHFDPAIDSVVRVEVGRLRVKLREYYDAFPDEQVVIRIPKGRYVADFELNESSAIKVGEIDRTLAMQPVLAVLPFLALGDDANDGYFAEGISDDLITDLSKISGLKVIARNSSFAYRNKPATVDVMGRELGASHILEGSVRRAGARLRINAQLAACPSGEQVWAERYDRDIADIFDVQDEVGRKIVAALSVVLTAADRYRRSGSGTRNLRAYDTLLRATALSWSRADVERACRLYDSAISLDPEYALAYAKRALVMWYLWSGGWDSDGTLEPALACVLKAAELDPELAEAHSVGGFIHFWMNDYAASEQAFNQAVSLDPDNVRNFERRAICLAALGRCDEATDYVERAVALNPHEPYFFPRGLIAFFDNELVTAVEQLRGSAERFGTFLPTRIFLAAALALSHDIAGAAQQVAQILQINPALSLDRLLAGWPPETSHNGVARLHSGFTLAWRASSATRARGDVAEGKSD